MITVYVPYATYRVVYVTQTVINGVATPGMRHRDFLTA
jgi:hypothetical protein